MPSRGWHGSTADQILRSCTLVCVAQSARAARSCEASFDSLLEPFHNKVGRFFPRACRLPPAASRSASAHRRLASCEPMPGVGLCGRNRLALAERLRPVITQKNGKPSYVRVAGTFGTGHDAARRKKRCLRANERAGQGITLIHACMHVTFTVAFSDAFSYRRSSFVPQFFPPA